ncbi:hypothetical protein JMJ35_005376 [Cladonia borealis]|uniref:non-specific serine/threonine protein kinase n=1 Tax=Cladonia borealis TaxID=184061 RepID=A0AA39V1G5_9LECA|nr:hypothetical protein JMJ35_005376 [Cladonia borealis]
MRVSDFRRVRRLGRGAEGTVWLERNRDTREYLACKNMKARVVVEEQPKEVWMIKNCMPDHRSLVEFVGWCWLRPRSRQRCNIYFEYCAGGDLRQLIPRRNPGRYPESFIWHVFIQLAEALDAMHNRGTQHVVHRDVKPENIFLKSRYRPNHTYPTIKLGDYGCASNIANTNAINCTWKYMPPEIQCSAAGDIWALGAVIHELCHGFGPVSTRRRNWQRDPAARRPKDLPSRYSDALHHQVMSCLRTNRLERPNSETLVRRLHGERPTAHQ